MLLCLLDSENAWNHETKYYQPYDIKLKKINNCSKRKKKHNQNRNTLSTCCALIYTVFIQIKTFILCYLYAGDISLKVWLILISTVLILRNVHNQ